MMGFGYWGDGGPSPSSSSAAASSSASSNLSALAPPFTVERFSLRPPTSNPSVQLSDSQPYAAAHVTWQYSNPSAPTCRPHVYQKCDLNLDSTRTTSVPTGNDYHFGYSVPQSNSDPQTTHWSTVNPCAKSSSSATFSYDAKVNSYYSPYVSPVVDHDSPLLALTEPSYDTLPSSGLLSSPNVPSQVDYTQSLSGLEYPPHWHTGWSGLIDAKRGKQAKLDMGFSLDITNAADSHAYGNHMNQGYHTVEYGDILEKDSSISFGQFSDANGREYANGLIRMEPVDNTSLLAQKILSPPFDYSRTNISSSSFQISASDSPCSSLELPKNFTNFQNSQHAYEKCILPHDSSVNGSLSVTKSPALVIRPPVTRKAGKTVDTGNGSLGKTVDTGNLAAIHLKGGLGSSCPAKGKEHHILFDHEVEEGSLISSQLKYQKEGNGQLFFVPSAVTEELSCNPQIWDGVNSISKSKSGSQVPSINVSDGSSLSGDCFQAIKSSDNVPDSLDHHNFAVDSPCWKGAPASHFSPLDVETEKTHPFEKKVDRYCQLDLQVDESFSLPNDSIRCSSAKAGEDKVHECNSAGRGISHISENISEADCTATQLKSIDAVKARFKGPSEGVRPCEAYNKPSEDCNLQTQSKNDSDLKSSGIKQLGVEDFTPSVLNFHSSVMDSVLNTSVTAEGSVAVRAAENVLRSPSSEEGAAEQATQHGCESAPKIDVQSLVKALQNLSELLVFNCITDSSALKDEDLEALKHVMSNLDVLASRKKEYFIQPQERIFRQQVTCHKIQNSADPHVNNAAGRHQFENEVGTNSHCHLDFQNTHDEMGNHNVTQEKNEKLQPLSPVTDGLEVLKDDNMAQAIKKVLEENFHSGEEMDSQALLFKNSWLEAEAKLCSISYRARFDRMKIEIEKLKSNQKKENAAALENMSTSSSHDLRISDMPPPKVDGSLQKTTICSSSLSSTSNPNDIEASVMTRFHILKCHDDSRSPNVVREDAVMVDDLCSDEMPFVKDQLLDGRLNVARAPNSQKKYDINQGQPDLNIGCSQNEAVKDDLSSNRNIDNVDAAIMTRFNILKCRDDLKGTNLVGGHAGLVDAVYSDIMRFSKDQSEDGGLNLAVEPDSLKTDVPVNQSSAMHGRGNHFSLGFNDNCPSDWEHGFKVLPVLDQLLKLLLSLGSYDVIGIELGTFSCLAVF
ncbi:unnamed protein product [Coffea canephora]|uniref:Uncharacterized protein n=1 Tax=Coffea canephora TaxID=49390 RepID=A0A068V5R2_COFCA|nr:unnamed protein product [Coffea canephora]